MVYLRGICIETLYSREFFFNEENCTFYTFRQPNKSKSDANITNSVEFHNVKKPIPSALKKVQRAKPVLIRQNDGSASTESVTKDVSFANNRTYFFSIFIRILS